MTNTFGRWDSRLVARIGLNKKLNPTLNTSPTIYLCITNKSKCNFNDNGAYLNECLRLKSWDSVSMLGLAKIVWVGLGTWSPIEPALRMPWSRAFSLVWEVALRVYTLKSASHVQISFKRLSLSLSLSCALYRSLKPSRSLTSLSLSPSRAPRGSLSGLFWDRSISSARVM